MITTYVVHLFMSFRIYLGLKHCLVMSMFVNNHASILIVGNFSLSVVVIVINSPLCQDKISSCFNPVLVF